MTPLPTLQVSQQKRAWQSLCEKERNSKRRSCLDASRSCQKPRSGIEVYVYAQWGVKFMRLAVIPYLSWKQEGPVSPALLTLHRSRMLKGRRWREVVYDFSSMKVTIKSNNIYRDVEGMCGPTWPSTKVNHCYWACLIFWVTRQSRSDKFLRENKSDHNDQQTVRRILFGNYQWEIWVISKLTLCHLALIKSLRSQTAWSKKVCKA